MIRAFSTRSLRRKSVTASPKKEEVNAVVRVELIEARNVCGATDGEIKSPFVELSIDEETVISTVKENEQDPVWDEVFTLHVKSLTNVNMSIALWHKTAEAEDELLGKYRIALDQLHAGRERPMWINMLYHDQNSNQWITRRVMLHLKLTAIGFGVTEEKPAARMLLVRVLEAEHLLPGDGQGLMKPYVELKMGEHSLKTDVQTKASASWNEKFAFPLKEADAEKLLIAVKHHGVTAKDRVGKYAYSLSTLKANVKYDLWIDLMYLDHRAGWQVPANNPGGPPRLHVSFTLKDVPVQQGMRASDSAYSMTPVEEGDPVPSAPIQSTPVQASDVVPKSLHVVVLRAVNLPIGKDAQPFSTQVHITVGMTQQYTSIARPSICPVWDENLHFPVADERIDSVAVAVLAVPQPGSGKLPRPLGKYRFVLHKLVQHKPHTIEAELKLQNPETKQWEAPRPGCKLHMVITAIGFGTEPGILPATREISSKTKKDKERATTPTSRQTSHSTPPNVMDNASEASSGPIEMTVEQRHELERELELLQQLQLQRVMMQQERKQMEEQREHLYNNIRAMEHLQVQEDEARAKREQAREAALREAAEKYAERMEQQRKQMEAARLIKSAQAGNKPQQLAADPMTVSIEPATPQVSAASPKATVYTFPPPVEVGTDPAASQSSVNRPIQLESGEQPPSGLLASETGEFKQSAASTHGGSVETVEWNTLDNESNHRKSSATLDRSMVESLASCEHREATSSTAAEPAPPEEQEPIPPTTNTPPASDVPYPPPALQAADIPPTTLTMQVPPLQKVSDVPISPSPSPRPLPDTLPPPLTSLPTTQKENNNNEDEDEPAVAPGPISVSTPLGATAPIVQPPLILPDHTGSVRKETKNMLLEESQLEQYQRLEQRQQELVRQLQAAEQNLQHHLAKNRQQLIEVQKYEMERQEWEEQEEQEVRLLGTVLEDKIKQDLSKLGSQYELVNELSRDLSAAERRRLKQLLVNGMNYTTNNITLWHPPSPLDAAVDANLYTPQDSQREHELKTIYLPTTSPSPGNRRSPATSNESSKSSSLALESRKNTPPSDETVQSGGDVVVPVGPPVSQQAFSAAPPPRKEGSLVPTPPAQPKPNKPNSADSSNPGGVGSRKNAILQTWKNQMDEVDLARELVIREQQMQTVEKTSFPSAILEQQQRVNKNTLTYGLALREQLPSMLLEQQTNLAKVDEQYEEYLKQSPAHNPWMH
eukprot:TRINITY_DN63707_c0_g1_i1.p1 TRINITY_DN63707_c0_g1~~TRINITY_DN63707_c0_g1_i1.p1  ORF type:complete len:1226 (+),score=170.42 TRINITY_DN63707_c0_g1_i1:37-3714(+)